MTWEDYSEFERWLNVAQLALDQAKSAVKDEDDSLFRKFVQQTQDALCEAVYAHDKAYKLELENQRGYCIEATTGQGIPITVELLETDAEKGRL